MNTHRFHVKPLTAAITTMLCFGLSSGIAVHAANAAPTMSAITPTQNVSSSKQDVKSTTSGKSKVSLTRRTKGKQKRRKKEKKEATNMKAIVVTGIAASVASSVRQQRYSNVIVHSVTASDINSMPDRTITEVLQRIPGVTVDKFIDSSDPDHPSAEGSGVLIRGLPYVESLLNGAETFSANNGRTLGFQDVPANLMARVSVYPNPSASMIEGGIGGTVDLSTRMPFDMSKNKIAFSIDENWGDISRRKEPEASFLYSNKWNTNAGKFGFTINFAHSVEASSNDGILVNPYTLRPNSTDASYYAPDIASGSSTSKVSVPAALNWQRMDFLRKRNGIYGAFQWSSPQDKVSFYSRFFRSAYNLTWKEHWVEYNEEDFTDVLPAPGTEFSYGPSGIFQKGTMASDTWRGTPPAAPLGGIGYYTLSWENQQYSKTTNWSNGFRYNVTNNLEMSGALQFVRSYADLTSLSVYNQFWLPPASIDLTHGTPSLTISDPGFLTNPANYYLGAVMDHVSHNYGITRTGRVDFDYYLESDWLNSIQFGVRATKNYRHNNNPGYNWGPISQDWMTPYKGPSSLTWANTVPSWMESQVTLSHFYRGANVPTTFWFPSLALVGNYRKAIPALESVEMKNATGGWMPLKLGLPGDSNSMSQKTEAAYFQLNFKGALFGVPFDGNTGVRYVITQANSNGSIVFPSTTAILDPASLSPAQLAFFKGVLIPNNGSNKYSNWLPSLNLTFHLTNNLQTRLALSRAMTRPPVDDLNSRVVLGTSWGGQAGAKGKFIGFTGTSIGNIGLKPLIADQADATIEWYPGGGDELFLDVFYKNIKNIINPAVTSIETINGQPVVLTGPGNFGRGIVRGAQAGYSQFFTSLPGFWSGFGISANYTFLRATNVAGTESCDPNHPIGSCPAEYVVTNPPLPMAGLSPQSYNFVLMYNKSSWEMRIAWNWRSRYLITTDDTGDTYLPVWAVGSGSLDATLFYHITKKMSVGLILNNITDSKTRTLMGPSTYAGPSALNPTTLPAGYVDHTLYPRGTFVNDRRAELVFRASF